MKRKKKLFSEIPVLKGERVTLRALTPEDSDGLRELTQSEEVYRYLPAFLFEKKYSDAEYVINHLYDVCLKESLILGVFIDSSFCGLAELYGCRSSLRKVSVGYRFLPRFWGQGIASEALGVIIRYVLNETDIEIITASTMLENTASANVLKKNGFKRVVHAEPENWGFPDPVLTDKWIRTGAGYRLQYRFQT